MMKESEQIKAIGELVEIDGHNIHVYRTGESDKPRLVFMSGSSTVAPAYDFRILYEKLQKDFRIIVVEKFGYGYSDIYDAPCDVDYLVNVQRTALNKIGEKGPYYLLPHSMGGIEAIRWIQMYPEEIKGLIGIDMTSPVSYAEWTDKDVKSRMRAMCILKRLGLYGISLSTVVALSVVEIPWLIYSVYHDVFTPTYEKEYVSCFLKEVFVTLISCAFASAANLIFIENIFVTMVVRLLAGLFISFFFYWLFFHRTGLYKNSTFMIKDVLERKQ